MLVPMVHANASYQIQNYRTVNKEATMRMSGRHNTERYTRGDAKGKSSALAYHPSKIGRKFIKSKWSFFTFCLGRL